MKWSELTPAARNLLVAEKVMGITDFRCTGKLTYDGNDTMRRYHDYICQECGVRLTVTEDYHKDCGFPKVHTIPIPRYSKSMDEALLVIGKMRNDHQCLWQITIDPNNATTPNEVILTMMDRSEFGCRGAFLAETICKVALRSVGVEIE